MQLFFIDNLNVAEENEEYLTHLANARCNIVCTSRIGKFSHYETVPIDYLNKGQCVELFYKYYKCEYDKTRIERIITRAGRHTLVIEILGKIGLAEGYSLKELENKLIQDGFDLEGIASVENKEDMLIGHLCRTFKINKLNDIQKEILYCMAILPVQWIPCDLKRWLKLQNNYNINYLIKYAWLEHSDDAYYMHPVIKEVVKREIKVSNSSLLQLLQGIGEDISYKENPDFEKSKLYISFAEAILDCLAKIKNPIVSQVAYSISILYGQFDELEHAKKYVNYTIEIEEEQNNSKDLLASAYNHRGYINYYSYNDKEAEIDYQNAYKLRVKLGKKKDIAATCSSLALLYQGMYSTLEEKDDKKRKLLSLAKKYEEKSVRMYEQIFDGTLHSNLASAYNNMAVIYYSLNELNSAIYYYRKAETIRIKLIDTISLTDLAVTYKGLCDSYKEMAIKTSRDNQKLIYYKIALINLNKELEIRESEIRNGNQKLRIDQIIKTKKDLENKIRMLCKRKKNQK